MRLEKIIQHSSQEKAHTLFNLTFGTNVVNNLDTFSIPIQKSISFGSKAILNNYIRLETVGLLNLNNEIVIFVTQARIWTK